MLVLVALKPVAGVLEFFQAYSKQNFFFFFFVPFFQRNCYCPAKENLKMGAKLTSSKFVGSESSLSLDDCHNKTDDLTKLCD